MISIALLQSYLLDKFEGKYKIGSGGEELIIPSIYEEDRGRMKMSINLTTGLWQDFKTHKVGNFVQLYAFLEGLPVGKAYDKLVFDSYFHDTEPPKIQKVEKTDIYSEELEGLEEVRAITGTNPEASELAVRAWSYLYERSLLDLHEDSLVYYVSHKGRFADRLIIPVFVEGNMIFYQGRALNLGHNPKYLTPHDVKGNTILAPFDYNADRVFVTEGPMDWITLKLAGVNATCTFGSSVSDTQMDSLKLFPGKIVMAYDNDEAGRKGIQRFERLRKQKRMPEFYVSNAPGLGCKDWNDSWVKGNDISNPPHWKYDFYQQLEQKLLDYHV